MKNKIFTLTIMSALALVMLIGMASAVSLDGISLVSSPSSVSNDAGSFDIVFDLTNKGAAGDLYYTLSNFTSSQTGLTFSFDDSDIAAGNSTDPTTETITATITFDTGQTGTITGNINVANNLNDTNPIDETLAFSVDLTEPTTEEPEEINGCSLDNDGDLSIEIDDISVTGFGGEDEDTEWFPLDEIEVEIVVENDNSDFDIENIEVHWGLYNEDTGKWYIDDEENDFDLKDDEEETIIINFKLDDDVDELENGNFVFYVWTEKAYLDDTDADVEIDLCAYASEDIEIIIENDFVILDKIELNEEAKAGDSVRITADVWNVGEDDQEDVYVLVYNQELGLNEKITIGDVDAFESETLDALIEIPSDAEAKDYTLTLYVFDEDDDNYENDYNDEESEFDVKLTISGASSASPNVLATASISEANAGEEFEVSVIVTNNGASGNFVVSASGYDSWATGISTQELVTAAKGESKTATLKLNINDDASGEQSFDLEIISSTGEVVSAKTVTVSLAEKTSRFTGLSILEGGNTYLWIIGALNVILVIVIIIVAIRVATK